MGGRHRPPFIHMALLSSVPTNLLNPYYVVLVPVAQLVRHTFPTANAGIQQTSAHLLGIKCRQSDGFPYDVDRSASTFNIRRRQSRCRHAEAILNRQPSSYTRRKKQSTVILWKQEKQPYTYRWQCSTSGIFDTQAPQVGPSLLPVK